MSKNNFKLQSRHLKFSSVPHKRQILIIIQADHLDILMKNQGEKTKTQEQTKNSRTETAKLKDFPKTLKILKNLNILCTNIHERSTF